MSSSVDITSDNATAADKDNVGQPFLNQSTDPNVVTGKKYRKEQLSTETDKVNY